MFVDGGTPDLIQRKATFLNISSEAYYGGGTWCSRRLWKTGEHQQRQLAGRRRLPHTLHQRQAGGEKIMETDQSQSEEDSQDVMDWGLEVQERLCHGGFEKCELVFSKWLLLTWTVQMVQM